MIAIDRVTNLLNAGDILMAGPRNPSIQICPANVPVIVELCPANNKAIAKAYLLDKLKVFFRITLQIVQYS